MAEAQQAEGDELMTSYSKVVKTKGTKKIA
jgi:hypothetical protein